MSEIKSPSYFPSRQELNGVEAQAVEPEVGKRYKLYVIAEENNGFKIVSSIPIKITRMTDVHVEWITDAGMRGRTALYGDKVPRFVPRK